LEGEIHQLGLKAAGLGEMKETVNVEGVSEETSSDEVAQPQGLRHGRSLLFSGDLLFSGAPVLCSDRVDDRDGAVLSLGVQLE
jgi:hypothetical protein